MNYKKTDITEKHSFFPTGEWEGFYTYAQGPGASRHKMSFILAFKEGLVTGGGADDITTFNWKGKYDLENLTCQMTKYYHGRHTVFYNGNVDENGIWGMWKLGNWFTGGFHIWPKGSKTAAQIAEMERLTEEDFDPEWTPDVIKIE